MSKTLQVAILLAGGSGQRFGADRPKQFVRIGERTVLEHSLAAFEQSPHIDAILIVSHPQHLDEVRELLPSSQHPKLLAVVAGGAERQDSTLNALRALHQITNSPLEQIRILIHDAVRPAVSQSIIERVCTALHTHQAANLVVPVTDTLLEINDNGTTAAMPSRARFRRVQTPQGFHAATLQHAYDVALTDPNFQATDDCGVVFRYLPKVEIALVEGEQRNIKLTYPEDLHVLYHLLVKS
jgi:2-C-methyl-D-erythritol 4-phosphate cytidylyltransferase